MSHRDNYQRMMEEHLALWRARLDSLAATASTVVKTRFQQELEDWKVAGMAAVAKLTELRAASGDSWYVIKLEMEWTWHAIEAALTQAENVCTAVASHPSVGLPPVAPAAPVPRVIEAEKSA